MNATIYDGTNSGPCVKVGGLRCWNDTSMFFELHALLRSGHVDHKTTSRRTLRLCLKGNNMEQVIPFIEHGPGL